MAEATQQSGLEGTVIGERFAVVSHLGHGRFGDVYLARNATGNPVVVAMKILGPDMLEDPKFTEQLLDRIEVLSGIDHPNLLRVFEIGAEDGFIYYAMEFCQGASLAELREGRASQILIPWEGLWNLIHQICLALKVLHQHGIVHEDLTPRAILLDANDRLKVTDLDFTRGAGATPAKLNLYTAPELWNGAQATVQSNLYTLGIIFYELATGMHPFQGGTRAETVKKQLMSSPAPLSSIRADAPRWAEQIIRATLAKDAQNRALNIDALLWILDPTAVQERPAPSVMNPPAATASSHHHAAAVPSPQQQPPMPSYPSAGPLRPGQLSPPPAHNAPVQQPVPPRVPPHQSAAQQALTQQSVSWNVEHPAVRKKESRAAEETDKKLRRSNTVAALSDSLRDNLEEPEHEEDPLQNRLMSGSQPAVRSAAFTSGNSHKAVQLELEEPRNKHRSNSMRLLMKAFGDPGDSGDAWATQHIRSKSLKMMMKDGAPRPSSGKNPVVPEESLGSNTTSSGTQTALESLKKSSKFRFW